MNNDLVFNKADTFEGKRYMQKNTVHQNMNELKETGLKISRGLARDMMYTVVTWRVLKKNLMQNKCDPIQQKVHLVYF